MKRLKRLLLAFGLWLGLGCAAFAQVNVVPQVGVINSYQKQYTYSAAAVGLVPPASATDIVCISGSGARAISIKRINFTMTGTAASVPVTLLRRASLDTGGTLATGNALPVAAPNNSGDPASIATLAAYTAVPTINDSSPVLMRSQIYVTAAATAQGPGPITFSAGEFVGTFTKGFDIPKSNTTQQWCINLNTTTVTSPVVDTDVTWTEQ